MGRESEQDSLGVVFIEAQNNVKRLRLFGESDVLRICVELCVCFPHVENMQ